MENKNQKTQTHRHEIVRQPISRKRFIAISAITTFLIIATLITIASMTKDTMQCDISGIQYRNLPEGVTCWDDGFSDKTCPMPTGINCKLEGSIPKTITAMAIAQMKA